MIGMGKWIFFLGLGIMSLGILIWLGAKIGIPLGKLPGDIRIQKEKYVFYFPLVTSIVLSLFLTVIINLLIWFFRKK
jgi:hypothetical protein